MSVPSEDYNIDMMPLKDTVAPIAGANYTYTVPADKAGRIYGLAFHLETDGNAANRTVVTDVSRGAKPLWRSPTSAVQTAGLDNYYLFWAGMAVSDGAAQAIRTWAFPNFIDLKAADVITITVTNKQVGDQITPQLSYKEMALI